MFFVQGQNSMSRPSIHEILKFSWEQQADFLRFQTKKDLEILWFQIQRHSECVDQLNIAIFSILRDMYEGAAQGDPKPERGLQSIPAGS